MNTVDIFHSLSSDPDYTLLLLRAVKVMMDLQVDVRVVHVPGNKNTVANALSHALYNIALNYKLNLKISTFKPLKEQVGARRT